MFVAFHSLFTICTAQKSLCISPSCKCTKSARERNSGRRGSCCRLSQTDPGELAALCRLSGDVRSRLPLPRCHHHRHCRPDDARGGAEPLEESFLPREAKAEETTGPRSRGYFKRAALFMAASHITSHFFRGSICFVSNFFFFFCQVSPNRLKWLIARKIGAAVIWFDR